MSFFSFSNSNEKEVWLVKPTSGLKVHGNTNVNSFACQVPSIGCYDTIFVQDKGQSKAFNINAELNVALSLFNCGNRMMTKDLLKTLRAEQYPHMNITFRSIDRSLSTIQVSNTVKVQTTIELAGVKKHIEVDFITKSINENKIELVGQRVICFSDFNLVPPTKMGGTIRVKDQLDVELKIMLEKQMNI
ncbi:MAG TPA: hypothetical protein PKD85_06815 [Saprospiraceae bacterium]|nr:hypothetical protein [Saprospiraceae bacterium]